MILKWISIFLISSSWLYFIPAYNSPDLITGSILLVLGVSIFIIDDLRTWRGELQLPRYVLMIMLILSLISAYISDFPYNIGLVSFSIAIAYLLFLTLLKTNRIKSCIYPVFYSLIVISLILSIQSLMISIYIIYGSRNHQIFSFVSYLFFILSKLVGMSAYISQGGTLYIQTVTNVYPFTATTEKLGVFFLVTFLTASLISILIYCKNRLLKIIVLLVSSFLYAIFRYLILMLIYINEPAANPPLKYFFDVNFIVLSFAFLPIILSRTVSCKRDTILVKKTTFRRKTSLLAVFALCLSVFLLTFSATFQDPGNKKGGKILVDEAHSEWESTTQAFTKDWYGTYSTYNYYSFTKWLKLL